MTMEKQNLAFLDILEYYKSKKDKFNQELLVEFLREVQEIYQYIPVDVQNEISECFQIKLSVISSLIKLYPSLKPSSYRHTITFCSGPRCSSKDAALLLIVVEKELNIKSGEITKDGRFFLRTQNCLKKCKFGPNMQIDQDYYFYLTVQEIKSVLNKYK